jgi:hypothetical protein
MEQDIKIVKLVNGDDIVCNMPNEQLPTNSPMLRVERPFQIKYVPQMTPAGVRDYVALMKWAAYTHDIVITIPKDKIITITNATDEMSKSYANFSKDYDKLEKKIDDNVFRNDELSEEENEKLNEIFNSFRDVKKVLN